MSVTRLADMHYPRAIADIMAARDSLGRVVVHGPPNVVGGTDYDITATSSYERYDPATNTWTILGTPNQIDHIYGWTFDSSDRWYYAAGQVLVDNTTFFTGTGHAEYYDPVGNAWHYLASLPVGQTRAQPYYWTGSGGELYLAGGLADGASGSHPAQDGPPDAIDWDPASGLFGNVLRFSGGPSGTWTKLSTSTVQTQFLQNHVPLVDSLGRAYILGSQAVGTGHLTQRYNTASDTWTALAAFPFQNSQFAACIVSDQIYIAGGATPTARTYRYDIASDVWTRLADMPAALRFNYVDQLLYHPYTNCIYSWGGFDGTDYLATIYQYDIGADAWSLSGDSLTVGRDGAATAFDGTGWYLLGGSQTGTFTGTSLNEYFVPAGVPVTTRRFAAIFG